MRLKDGGGRRDGWQVREHRSRCSLTICEQENTDNVINKMLEHFPAMLVRTGYFSKSFQIGGDRTK